MKHTVRYLLFAIVVATSGCKSENPNPELLDPIYKDLDKRASDAQHNLDDELKKQLELRTKIDQAEPNTIELKHSQLDLDKSLKIAAELEQKTHYYKIRAQRRLLVDRISYRNALKKHEPWPDPNEYSQYLINTRLNEVSLNWNARVPKLQDRLSASRAPTATPQPSANKGE